jgi:hypothetical protein
MAMPLWPQIKLRLEEGWNRSKNTTILGICTPQIEELSLNK